MEVLIGWLAFSILAGWIASSKRRSALGFCLRALVLFLAAILSISARAQNPSDDIKSWPAARCRVSDVLFMMKMDNSYAQARVSAQMLPILDQVRTLNDKAKDPKKPLGDQLTPSDVARFGALRQQILAMNLLMLIESKRERDLDLLGKMVELTDSSYRWDKTPDESNADYAIYGAVVLLAVVHSDGSKLSFANFGACSFSSAIDLLAIEPLQRLNTLDVETATRKLNRIAAKYRDRPLNPEKLSPQDKAIYLSLMNDTVNPALKTKDYLLALQNIKLMERASALIYSTSREEAAISGGDISAIGATIKTMMEQKKLDQEMQVAIALWYKLNEKYPAPIIKEFEEISRAANRK